MLQLPFPANWQQPWKRTIWLTLTRVIQKAFRQGRGCPRRARLARPLPECSQGRTTAWPEVPSLRWLLPPCKGTPPPPWFIGADTAGKSMAGWQAGILSKAAAERGPCAVRLAAALLGHLQEAEPPPLQRGRGLLRHTRQKASSGAPFASPSPGQISLCLLTTCSKRSRPFVSAGARLGARVES